MLCLYFELKTPTANLIYHFSAATTTIGSVFMLLKAFFLSNRPVSLKNLSLSDNRRQKTLGHLSKDYAFTKSFDEKN